MRTQINHDDENNIQLLYKKLLESWNSHNAPQFASLFGIDANVIGFDGSQMNGKKQINDELTKIFSDHEVSSYVGIIKEIRTLSPTVFLLRAVAGMVPPGELTIKKEVNAIQSLIATKENDQFIISLYQNTPAAFHGRPELGEQLTKELQSVFDSKQIIQIDYSEDFL